MYARRGGPQRRCASSEAVEALGRACVEAVVARGRRQQTAGSRAVACEGERVLVVRRSSALSRSRQAVRGQHRTSTVDGGVQLRRACDMPGERRVSGAGDRERRAGQDVKHSV